MSDGISTYDLDCFFNYLQVATLLRLDTTVINKLHITGYPVVINRKKKAFRHTSDVKRKVPIRGVYLH